MIKNQNCENVIAMFYEKFNRVRRKLELKTLDCWLTEISAC